MAENKHYKMVNGEKVEMTPQEIAAVQSEQRKAELMEKTRHLTEAEVSWMLITAHVNSLSVDDNTALRMKEFYPEWKSGTEYTSKAGRPVGFKVRHDKKLWKLKQEHTALENWQPGAIGTESLWEEVNETHAGTLDDPIPYDGNMALEKGKYYAQNYEVYLCFWDTGIPVYNPLRELVDIYVEVIV